MNIKKILTITYNDLRIPYGPSVHFLELWNNIKDLDKNIEIIGISPSWTKNKEIIIKPKFTLKEINVPNIPFVRQLIYDFYIMIFTLLNYKKFDIIYIRLSNFHLFSGLILKLFKINYILELNGIIKDDTLNANKSLFYRILATYSEKLLLKNAKGCIAVSEGIKKFASQYCDCENIKVIHNGVNSELFEIINYSTSLKNIVYVGTFTPWDGHKKILKLATKFPSINFIFVGDGLNRIQLQEKYRHYKNIMFLGYVNYKQLKNIYSQADGGIVLYERNFRNNMKLSSLKTLEYIASGLPVFSTNVPGQEFIFENNIGYEAGKNIEEDFKCFISNYKKYKKNVYCYREKLKKNVSWSVKAQGTIQFIRDIVNV